MFFPHPSLLCARPRSRCTSIQINISTHILLVPLRPACKLKLTMDWREQEMRGRRDESCKRKEREKNKRRLERNTEDRGGRKIKAVKETVENKNIAPHQLTGSLSLCPASQLRQEYKGAFGTLGRWLRAEMRWRGGGQKEEKGRRHKTARSMPNNIPWMSVQTLPGCQAA